MPLLFNKKHHDAIMFGITIEQAREALQCFKAQLPAAFKKDSPYKEFDNLYIHALDQASTKTIILLSEVFGIKHKSPEPQKSASPSPFVTLNRDFITNFKLISHEKFDELSVEFDDYPEELSEKSKESCVASSFVYLLTGSFIYDEKLNYKPKKK